MTLSLLSLVVTVVTVYYVAGALQQTMADAISREGEHYFAFVLFGTIVFSLATTALTAVPSSISGGISSGFFEALLVMPMSRPTLVCGLAGYSVLWSALRGLVLLSAGVVLGAGVAWGRAPEALLILLLIVVCYFACGLIAAALVLAFRTTAYVPQTVMLLSGLLGGVYYPVDVLPGPLHRAAEIVPLGYGLRAMRRLMLEGVVFGSVTDDVIPLVLYAVVLLSLGALSFTVALQFARRSGSLSQY